MKEGVGKSLKRRLVTTLLLVVIVATMVAMHDNRLHLELRLDIIVLRIS